MPEFGEVVEQNDAGTEVTVSCNRRSRQINLFYRTKDMMAPNLVYAENSLTNEVACMASFVPTFEPPAPQENLEILEDEEPEAVNLSQGSDFHFFFLVDRSGSMRGFGRLTSAIDALKLFIRSLPTGCKFSIKSFGSKFSDLKVD